MVLSNKENIIPFEWFFNAARECLAQLWQYLKCWYNEKKLLRVGQAIYCDILLNALGLVLYVHIKSDKIAKVGMAYLGLGLMQAFR